MRLLFLSLGLAGLAFAGMDASVAAKHLEGLDATFVVLNGRSGEVVRHNPSRAATRFAPCSTFKIPNSALLLESGVVRDAEHLLKYDPALKLEGAWAQDQTLRTAFQRSALWYYQEMARRLGSERLQMYVNRFDYGNRDVSGPVDKAWLGNPLKISPDEQVRFLQRLHDGKLGLSARTSGIMNDIMLAGEGAGYKLKAKTGACRAPGEPVSLWYVGWVEKGGDVYYFALQAGGAEYEPGMSKRVPLTKAILKDMGILP